MDLTFIPILLMVGVATLMACGMLFSSWFLGRVKRSHTDLSPYECGLDPLMEAHRKISVRYYLVALLFLLFDVEVVFLYPVAVAYKGMVAEPFLQVGHLMAPGWSFVFFEFVLFVAVLVAGYLYAWGKGAFQWE